MELDKIKMSSTGLFKVPHSNMYKFCFINKIYTVKELFDYINNYGFNYGNNLVKSEIVGIVELLMYKYLCNKMGIDEILNSKFIKNDYWVVDNKIDWYFSKQIKKFRRLGFSKEEARLFILFANSIDNELLVGEALMLFANNFLNNVPYQASGYYDTYKNKIHLLVAYYKQYSELYNNSQALKKLYGELKNMILQSKKNEEDIKLKKIGIENVASL